MLEALRDHLLVKKICLAKCYRKYLRIGNKKTSLAYSPLKTILSSIETSHNIKFHLLRGFGTLETASTSQRPLCL
jgi:hypothetical protein